MKNQGFVRMLSATLAALMVLLAVPASVFAGAESSQLPDISTTDITPSNDVTAPGKDPGDDSGGGSSTSTVRLPEELNSTFETTVGDVIDDGRGFRLQLNADRQSYCIISYRGSAKDVTIPDSYEGLPITRIGDSAFFRKGLERVTLSDNITSMGIDVFFECGNLQYNTFEGDNGRYLGTADNPYFYYVSPQSSDVTEVTIHPETRIIAKYALRACRSLRSVNVPGENIIQMGFGMVFDCPQLDSLTIPYVGERKGGTNNAHLGYIFGSRTYGGNIAYVPQSLRTLAINGGSIVKSALYGVDMIESLTVPELSDGYLSYFFGGDSYQDNIVPVALKNVTVMGGELGEGAFYKCTGLVSITIPDGVTSISKYAFYECSRLVNVNMSDDVTNIGNYTFYNCSSLTSIKIPEGVTSIGLCAFRNCRNLSEIIIPNKVSSVGKDAFYDTEYYNNKSNWVDEVLYISNCLIKADASILGSYSIMPGTKCIADEAFDFCTGLTDVTISGSVTSVGGSAFSNCSGLTSVTISSGVERIGNSAFYSCCSLANITIANSVTSIGSSAFYSCRSLTSVTIPSSVTSIGNWVFADCESITSITIPDGVTRIGEYAFYYCSNLTNITIPDGITSIGKNAFCVCSSLKSITIPDSVINIGDNVFLGCYKLEINCVAKNKPVEWSDSWNPNNRPVTWGCRKDISETTFASSDIDDGSTTQFLQNKFAKCVSAQIANSDERQNILKSNTAFNIGYCSEDNTDIKKSTNAAALLTASEVGSPGLDFLLIGGTYYSVSKGTCTDANIVIPSSYNGKPVVRISGGAFSNCYNLTSIIIPDSLVEIGDNAFYCCNEYRRVCIWLLQ